MFQIETTPAATIVRVESAIDASVDKAFFDVLLLASNAGTAAIVVVLDACPYFDCAGLGALAKMRNAMRAPMSVHVRADSFLHRLFSISGLQERLNVSEVFNADAAA